MKQILFFIFHLIIVSNACFTFQNSTERICSTYIHCFIDNPYIKIQTIECEPHSQRHLRLTMHNIDIMEKFFLNNTETVDKFFDLLYNDSYTLLYIHIKNGLSSRQNEFRIDNRSLRKLFGRYISFYSVFILNMMFKRLPKIRIYDVGLAELVKPQSLMWLQFNTSTGFCSIQIRTDLIRDDMYLCTNSKKRNITSLSMLDAPSSSSTSRNTTEFLAFEETTSVSPSNSPLAMTTENQKEEEKEEEEEDYDVDLNSDSTDMINYDYNWKYSTAITLKTSIISKRNKTNHSSLWFILLRTGIILMLIGVIVYCCVRKNRYIPQTISQPVPSYYPNPTINNEN